MQWTHEHQMFRQTVREFVQSEISPHASQWEADGTSVSVRFWDALLERYLGVARDRLGADAARVWADGRRLTFDEAVGLALGR